MSDYRHADRATRLSIATADHTSIEVLKQLGTDEDAERAFEKIQSLRQTFEHQPNHGNVDKGF